MRSLIARVPDRTIRNLESILASGGGGDRSIALIHELVNAEMLERRVRAAVFTPVAPVGDAPREGARRFPPQALNLAWAAVKALDPLLVGAAMRAASAKRAATEAPPIFDEICLKIAAGLREGEPAFAPVSEALERDTPGLAARFVQALSLSPLVRSTLPRLPVWVRTLSNDYAAAIRVAFNDSVAVSEDAGPAFMELLYGHLEEPWQMLRLISLVMDKPTDRYLAASELGSFGERLLADTDRRIEALRRFDGSGGLATGVELAASVQTATTVIDEFEQWIAVSRDSPWGRRLAAQKRSLALTAEARLRELEGALNAALPVEPGRFSVRGMPNLAGELDQRAVAKAHALLAFLYETRAFASYGGFGALRTKTVEALDPRIDQYVEDLIELLHARDGDLERIRAYLDVAAEFLGLVREPRAAEIVRRRAAVA